MKRASRDRRSRGKSARGNPYLLRHWIAFSLPLEKFVIVNNGKDRRVQHSQWGCYSMLKHFLYFCFSLRVVRTKICHRQKMEGLVIFNVLLREMNEKFKFKRINS